MAMKIGLLRALWRVAGNALYDGAPIDLDGLPPGFGGAMGAMPILGELEQAQFVEWRRLGGGDRVSDPRRPLSAYPLSSPKDSSRRPRDMTRSIPGGST